MVMGEIVPGISRFAVILAHRSPLPFAQVGPPFLPWKTLLPCFIESFSFRIVAHGSPLRCFSQRLAVAGVPACRTPIVLSGIGRAVVQHLDLVLDGISTQEYV